MIFAFAFSGLGRVETRVGRDRHVRELVSEELRDLLTLRRDR